MNFPITDGFVPVQPPGKPSYDSNNPLVRVMREVERVTLAAERDAYLADSLQYLFPYRDLALYGPSGDEWERRHPRRTWERFKGAVRHAWERTRGH